MAQLDITGATIGYDERNIQTALNNLNRDAIQAAMQKMTDAMQTLVDAVNAAWVGKSAETFKSNMYFDKDMVCKGLQDSYNVLENEMHQIVNEMSKVDAALVEERNEG